jgi:hypothetical protein
LRHFHLNQKVRDRRRSLARSRCWFIPFTTHQEITMKIRTKVRAGRLCGTGEIFI